MKRPFKTYNGGKNGSGVYQAIINQVPPHDVFISGFAGNCGVLSNIRRAPMASIAIDVDAGVIEGWNSIKGIKALNSDFFKYLDNFCPVSFSDISYFFYLDPPYLGTSRKSNQPLYKNEMQDPATHKKLLLQAKKIEYPVCINHYPCELYDTMLKGWRKLEIIGRTRSGMVTDCLYMNYPEPTALHDYRYIGNDYREREMYKKSKKNMLAKFARMTALERSYVISELQKANIFTHK